MNEITRWASLREASEFVDVSKDTILRRAVPYVGKIENIERDACPKGKVRYRLLTLGEGTRQERRYYVPDLERWLN